MQYITPEQAGISSAAIQEYIQVLEDAQLSMHDVILIKGNDVFFEGYWAPFHKDFKHRMYSVSKSFISLAVGFAIQDGLLDLDDKMSKHFPKELEGQTDENMRNQTVRHMLMMSTAKTEEPWFSARTDDRVRFYFENKRTESRPSGTIFQYDSPGSFVICALVERLTGMPFMDYLRQKLFDKIGVSNEAHCLKCPGGHSWGDSAVLCTPMDLAKVARFTLNKGAWNGNQLLNADYVTAATGKQIDNNVLGINACNTQGYGYLFWRTWQDSYFFNGMGSQFAICVPGKDLIMVCNADNQGKEQSRDIIIDNFFKMIVDKIADAPLAEDEKAQKELQAMASGLKLMTAKGATESAWQEKVNGVTYVMNENEMGITKMRVVFDGAKSRLEYTNAQGDKTIYFGMGENAFAKFPQEGYSKDVGSVFTKGHYYDCAASAAWTEPHKLFIKVQIIDEYFGNLNITMSYTEDKLGVYMTKTAEDFLDEYVGFAGGIKEM